MKKVLACAVSALMLTALLAGCGGENTNNPSGTDTTDPSSGSKMCIRDSQRAMLLAVSSRVSHSAS